MTKDTYPRTKFLEALGSVLEDVVLTGTLLIGLIFINFLASKGGLSEDFRALFSKIHEWVFLFNYLLLALRGFVRLAMLPWNQ